MPNSHWYLAQGQQLGLRKPSLQQPEQPPASWQQSLPWLPAKLGALQSVVHQLVRPPSMSVQGGGGVAGGSVGSGGRGGCGGRAGGSIGLGGGDGGDGKQVMVPPPSLPESLPQLLPSDGHALKMHLQLPIGLFASPSKADGQRHRSLIAEILVYCPWLFRW